MFNIKASNSDLIQQRRERNERVPLSQGLELYNALKRQGCTTKMFLSLAQPARIETAVVSIAWNRKS